MDNFKENVKFILVYLTVFQLYTPNFGTLNNQMQFVTCDNVNKNTEIMELNSKYYH